MENSSTEKTARRVAKNSLAQIVRFAAIATSKFLIVVVIARWAGVEQVGDFSSVMNFALALTFLNNFGLVWLLMREVAQQRERVHEYVGNALTLCLGLGILSVMVMGGIATILGYSGRIVAGIYLTALALVLDTLGNLFNAAFGGYERMELGTLSIVIQEFAFLIVGAAILYLRAPFLWLFALYVLSRLVGLVASAHIYWRLWGRPRLRFDLPVVKKLSHKTLPFALNVALSPIFVRIDVILLSYFKGSLAVGYYEVASTLFYRLNVLARMFNLALMPLVAHEYPILGWTVVRYVRRAVRYQAVVGVPITALCWILGGKIITFIYGPEFEPAIFTFQILATITFLRFLDNALANTLTAIDLQARRSLAIALMAIFNIGLNLFIIPRYGYIGAAVTSVLTEIGYFILLFGFVRSRLPSPVHLSMLVRPVLASVVMALPLLLGHNWPLPLLLPLGVGIYGLAALVLRVFSPEELAFLLKVGRVEHMVPPGLRRLLMPSSHRAASGQEQAMLRSDS